jgi:uncharacterized iron-regulated membrane protein
VARPSRQHIEVDGKRLLHPLHYQRQLQAVIGLDVKREPRPFKLKPAYLEAVTCFCLAKYAAEERFGPREMEKRLADINRRSHFVPYMLGQFTFRSHIGCLRTIYMRLSAVLLYLNAKKVKKSRLTAD